MRERGFLVASDQNMQWLLPWWWERYSACNAHPVCFIDFGMTLEARKWCAERGQVLLLPETSGCHALSQERESQLEQIYGKSWLSSRPAWFKKPLACLHSPFEETVWLDLDCEVLCPLEEIFDYISVDKEMALTFGSTTSAIQGLEEPCQWGTVCNSGVIVFHKTSSLIHQWVEIARDHSDQYFGDECILSKLICESLEKVSLLPEIYNWKMSRGVPLYAKIIHWKGEWGKQYIAKHGGLKPALCGQPHIQKLFDFSA